MLFDKMKELNAARCQNLPLKAEVESLRALIDEEEKRSVLSHSAAATQLNQTPSEKTKVSKNSFPLMGQNIMVFDVVTSMELSSPITQWFLSSSGGYCL